MKSKKGLYVISTVFFLTFSLGSQSIKASSLSNKDYGKTFYIQYNELLNNLDDLVPKLNNTSSNKTSASNKNINISKVDNTKLKKKDVSKEKSKVLYKGDTKTVSVFKCNNKQIYITDKDVHLMAQVVYGESRGEPYDGKVAVASVILNRVKDKHFPNTIDGVIKQKGAFSCVKNSKITCTPTEECISAVYDALNGKDPSNNALFFYNPQISKCNWMKNTKKSNTKTIGRHVFFVIN